MPVLINKTSRGHNIQDYRLLPKSKKVMDSAGNVTSDVPPHIAYSPQAKHLADQGLIEIPGYRKQAPIVLKPPAKEPAKEPSTAEDEKGDDDEKGKEPEGSGEESKPSGKKKDRRKRGKDS